MSLKALYSLVALIVCFCSACSGKNVASAADSPGPALVSPAAPASPSIRSLGPLAKCLNGRRYSSIFDDEFKELGPLDPSKYETAYPWGNANPGARDDAYDTGVNAKVMPDGLTISAEPASPAIAYNGKLYDYTSDVVIPHNFTFLYGYIEFSARLPSGRGMWPGLWMLATNGFPGETDVLEQLNGTRTAYQTVHYGGNAQQQIAYQTPFDPATGFHTYGALWSAAGIQFYVDDVPTNASPFPSNVDGAPMYVLMNLQVGGAGSWPGPPDSTTKWPQQLVVRYLRIYQATSASC